MVLLAYWFTKAIKRLTVKERRKDGVIYLNRIAILAGVMTIMDFVMALPVMDNHSRLYDFIAGIGCSLCTISSINLRNIIIKDLQNQ
jgi:hypothetical protein